MPQGRSGGKETGQQQPDGREGDPPWHRKAHVEAAQRTKDIREAVQKELEFDPLVDASDISVKNMNGDVALNGTVPAYPQYLQAAAAAKRVQGVTRVHNHLMVDLPFAELPGRHAADHGRQQRARDECQRAAGQRRGQRQRR